eukprot:GABV01009434.1.p2 GENE.GABV01009434.1~~GABV01009434.1.p2  ORF type:complete len:125 (+),score=26.80 GABV01009434.1:41-415(+)
MLLANFLLILSRLSKPDTREPTARPPLHPWPRRPQLFPPSPGGYPALPEPPIDNGDYSDEEYEGEYDDQAAAGGGGWARQWACLGQRLAPFETKNVLFFQRFGIERMNLFLLKNLIESKEIRNC